MKVLFLADDGEMYKFEHTISLKIKGEKATIRYKDDRGEIHEEIGDLPEDVYVFRDMEE